MNSTNDTWVIIIWSEEPGMFCSGADLKERWLMSQDEAVNFVKKLWWVFHEFSTI